MIQVLISLTASGTSRYSSEQLPIGLKD